MASFYRREVLQQAWAIIWRKKYLWFIAFFAGLASYGGEVNFLFRKFNAVTTFQQYLVALRDLFVEGKAQTYLHQFTRVFSQSPGSVLGYLGVGFVILIVGLWLMFTSQGAVIRIIGRTQDKKASDFFDGIATGAEKFWSIVQVNIIGVLLGWAGWIIVAGLPATIFFLSGQVAWASAARVGAVVSVLISAIITLLVQYSTAGLVLRDLSPIPALSDSWKLFRRNIAVSIEMALIIFLINLGVLVITFGIFDVLGLFFSAVGLIILLVLVAIEFAALSAFSLSAWTILYQKLLTGGVNSKIGQWTTQLVSFTKPKPSA